MCRTSTIRGRKTMNMPRNVLEERVEEAHLVPFEHAIVEPFEIGLLFPIDDEDGKEMARFTASNLPTTEAQALQDLLDEYVPSEPLDDVEPGIQLQNLRMLVEDNHVVTLDMQWYGLGHIPREVLSLPYLREIWIKYNKNLYDIEALLELPDLQDVILDGFGAGH